jgi:hypothetical protein
MGETTSMRCEVQVGQTDDSSRRLVFVVQEFRNFSSRVIHVGIRRNSCRNS